MKDTHESIEEKRAFVTKQTREAQATGYVTLQDVGVLRSRTIPVWMAFRCLYCGEYFNRPMAEDHFGMTRKAFLAKLKKESEIEK